VRRVRRPRQVVHVCVVPTQERLGQLAVAGDGGPRAVVRSTRDDDTVCDSSSSGTWTASHNEVRR
jgi:hypothetical protein